MEVSDIVVVVPWLDDVQKRGEKGVRLRLVGRLRRVTTLPLNP